MPELAWPRNHVELPEKLTGPGIEPHDIARNVLDAGLVVAGLVSDENHYDSVHHDRRG